MFYLYCKPFFYLEKKTITTSYTTYTGVEKLSSDTQKIIQSAVDACQKAYAPYSDFPVGAALIDAEGAIYSASNQENVSFPAGTCAERSLLNFYKSNHPNTAIKAIAIAATKSQRENPISPCGFCRQVLSEVESLQEEPIRLYLLSNSTAEVWEFDSVSDLLPLVFKAEQLIK